MAQGAGGSGWCGLGDGGAGSAVTQGMGGGEGKGSVANEQRRQGLCRALVTTVQARQWLRWLGREKM